MNKQKAYYYLIRMLTFPIRYLPYRCIHALGRVIGSLLYYCLKDFRKRALGNLALADTLGLSNEELPKIAKQTFQNLAITILEYPKFDRETDFSKIIHCINPEKANELFKEKQSLIFFCGHQANWEVLFIDGNLHMKGTAMGKPIKNPYLYQWIISIREKTGGKIIDPKNALKEGLRTLRDGKFLGIVGDQSMPSSHYAFPFFGRRAWTSTAPGLLAYKTNTPIIVATTRREKGKYLIHYSDPIWPDKEAAIETEVMRLMDSSLFLLQEDIRKSPGQWLWQHNRYKQQTPHRIYKEYRHESVLIVLPETTQEIEKLTPHLKVLQDIYESSFFFILSPRDTVELSFLNAEKIFQYKSPHEMLLKDYRFKIVFNFSKNDRLKKHYLSLSAYQVLSKKDFSTLANNKGCFSSNLSEQIVSTLCRMGTYAIKRQE